jgi:hypothetical protein
LPALSSDSVSRIVARAARRRGESSEKQKGLLAQRQAPRIPELVHALGVTIAEWNVRMHASSGKAGTNRHIPAEHMSHITPSIVRWYYLLATPVFWLVDLFWDAPLRASFIPDQRLRYAYYAGCVGCGLLIWKQPSFARGIGMTESLANFTMAILSIWIPMMNAYDVVATTGTEPTLSAVQPINAGISGAFALISFYSRQRDT